MGIVIKMNCEVEMKEGQSLNPFDDEPDDDIEMTVDNLNSDGDGDEADTEEDDPLAETKASFEASKQPRNFGKVTCFFYDPVSNMPKIAIGPHWKFSVVKEVFTLTITITVISLFSDYPLYTYSLITLTIIENLAF